VSSTRDCPSCGREAGFHRPTCCYEKHVDAELDAIKQKLSSLYAECLAWSAKGLSQWGQQLVDYVGSALGTCRWLEHDVEVHRLDREAQQKEKSNAQP
jgi:hypothetical protein